MATLFTLPQHLRDTINALAEKHILPPDLQKQVDEAIVAADRVQFEDEDELAAEREIDNGGKIKRDERTEKGTPFPPVPTLRPATVDAEVLESLARWADGHAGEITAAGLAEYGSIALLAGTTVYLPPRQRALARAAERNSDKPNPLLPRHLSPHPSSIGSEVRSTLSTLSTVLNVLFSIFGVGGGAYAAATSGGGWSRESAILLAVVVGIVVGVADVGLLWIYSRKKQERKVQEGKLRVRENKGSGRMKGTEPVELHLEDAEKTHETGSTEVPNSVISPPPNSTNIRLRRRALD